ncbi:hypothetical protein ACET3Z_030985 [Daucus carota]
MKLGVSSSADQREKDGAINVPVTSVVPSFPCILKRRCIVSDLSSEVLESADLLREILVKLPPKTVFGFTLVSSQWNKTITDPELTCLLKVPRNPSAVFVRRLVLQENDDVVKYTHIPLKPEFDGRRRIQPDGSMRRGTFDMLELKTDRSMWFIKYHIDLTGRVSRDENLQIIVLALLPGEEQE